MFLRTRLLIAYTYAGQSNPVRVPPTDAVRVSKDNRKWARLLSRRSGGRKPRTFRDAA